jgi:hypothetical protein
MELSKTSGELLEKINLTVKADFGRAAAIMPRAPQLRLTYTRSPATCFPRDGRRLTHGASDEVAPKPVAVRLPCQHATCQLDSRCCCS